MDIATALSLVKERIGIRTTVRDTYITAIINGLIRELEDEKGVVLDMTNPYHLLFVVDYAAWRYGNSEEKGGMPRHLQFRMNNLMIHTGGGSSV